MPFTSPAATVMVVTVTATTTSGRPLTPEMLAKALEGCDMLMTLDADKQKVRGQGGHRGRREEVA